MPRSVLLEYKWEKGYEVSQRLKTLGCWEISDWRLQGVAESRDPEHTNQRSYRLETST